MARQHEKKTKIAYLKHLRAQMYHAKRMYQLKKNLLKAEMVSLLFFSLGADFFRNTLSVSEKL